MVFMKKFWTFVAEKLWMLLQGFFAKKIIASMFLEKLMIVCGFFANIMYISLWYFLHKIYEHEFFFKKDNSKFMVLAKIINICWCFCKNYEHYIVHVFMVFCKKVKKISSLFFVKIIISKRFLQKIMNISSCISIKKLWTNIVNISSFFANKWTL